MTLHNALCTELFRHFHHVMQDVVYFLQPLEDCLVSVSTCTSAQFVDDFDTVLYVLGNATGPGPTGIVSCNDDACSYLSQLQVTAPWLFA